MDIRIIDHTAQWREWVSAAAGRWHDALAPRGITVSYEWGDGAFVPLTGTPSDGLVHVTDAQPWIPGHWGDSWQWDSGPWPGGWSHLYGVPSVGEYAIACVVHELGHVFGLSHAAANDDAASVMTPMPHASYPSPTDAARAMRGYPLPVSPPPSPPGKHTGKGGKGKKHKGKKHG